jgi:hypothetical protein
MVGIYIYIYCCHHINKLMVYANDLIIKNNKLFYKYIQLYCLFHFFFFRYLNVLNINYHGVANINVVLLFVTIYNQLCNIKILLLMFKE